MLKGTVFCKKKTNEATQELVIRQPAPTHKTFTYRLRSKQTFGRSCNDRKSK